MNSKTLMILGAAGILGGAFLPWITVTSTLFGSTSVTGMAGDGVIFAGVGAILLVAALLRKPSPGKPAGMLYSLVGVAVLAFAVYEVSNVLSAIADSTAETVSSSPGIGLPVITIGALLFAVGSAQSEPAPTPVAPPSTEVSAAP